MDFIFEKFSISPELQGALHNQSGDLGHHLALCFNIESSNFSAIQESKKQLNLDEASIMQCYKNALLFADESLI